MAHRLLEGQRRRRWKIDRRVGTVPCECGNHSMTASLVSATASGSSTRFFCAPFSRLCQKNPQRFDCGRDVFSVPGTCSWPMAEALAKNRVNAPGAA